MAKAKTKIPTLAGVIIIIVAVIIFFGGAFAYQHFLTNKNIVLSKQTNLTVTQIENAQVSLSPTLVKLSNGEFVSADHSQGISILTSPKLGKMIFFGDLNGDGVKDAIAVMDDYCGGAGTCSEDLAVWLNKSGKPQYVTKVGLGYRPNINSVKIQNQIITIDMYPSDTSNPQYPNQPREIVSYKLVNNTLQEENQANDLKTYTNSNYGFSFQYPANYQVETPDKNLMNLPNSNNIIELYGSPDRIIITYVHDSVLDLSSAKYGPEHIWFDVKNDRWATDTVRQADGHNMINDITFHTTDGSTYFQDDHGIYSQDIVPLSDNAFIIINAADSGPIADIIDRISQTFKFTPVE